MTETININEMLNEKFGQPDKMNAQRRALGLPEFQSAFGAKAIGGDEDNDPLDDIAEPIEAEKPEPVAPAKTEEKDEGPSKEWVILNESISRQRAEQSRALQELAEIRHRVSQQPQITEQPPSPEDPDYRAYQADQRAQRAEQRSLALESQVLYDRAERSYKDLVREYPDFKEKIPKSRFEESYANYARTAPDRLKNLNWEGELRVAYDALTKPAVEKERDELKRKVEELEGKLKKEPTRAAQRPQDSSPIPRAARTKPATAKAESSVAMALAGRGRRGGFKARGLEILTALERRS